MSAKQNKAHAQAMYCVLYNLHWGRKDTVMMNRRYNDDNDDNVEYVLLENITYHGITFRAWKETVDFIEK